MKALEVKNLRKEYKDGTLALKDVSFDINQGEFFSLLGLNGAGKTTLIGIVTDLVKKSSGTVKVMGHDLDLSRNEAKSQIGLVPQEFNFNVFLTVQEILRNYAGYFNVPANKIAERTEEVLNRLQLTSKRHTQVRFLSGGMKRRVMIARALMHEPKLLILDEPTAGVDVDLRREIWNLLQELNQSGMTIILTSHYMEEVEALCQRIAILHQGIIIRTGDIASIQEVLSTTKYTVTLNKEPDVTELMGIQGVQIEGVDQHSMHVSVELSIHPLLERLIQTGYEVGNIYIRTNRLESYFLGDIKEQV